jgi:guanosine-3',5'-bis(diphosphate) 3'-pyrophosphohydrolase
MVDGTLRCLHELHGLQGLKDAPEGVALSAVRDGNPSPSPAQSGQAATSPPPSPANPSSAPPAMIAVDELIRKVRLYHPAAPVELIQKAYAYAQRMHEGQKRKSGDPYFIHPVNVANIIVDMKLDTASICAGLLHDVVEDTGVSTEEVAKQFGADVAFVVDGVTKLGKLNFVCREDQQAESFRKMLVAMASDIRVLLVKLADRLDNMRTLEFMKPESQERIARETMEIYAPLAGRLGMQAVKSELEDLSFRYLHPEAYENLAQKTAGASADRDSYIADVTHQLEQMLIERGFAAQASGRYKHLYSVYRNMRHSQCEFEQIQDYVAFRVIVETVADCYAALGVIHSQWTPIPGRFKDFIALPKPNMYQSLHTTVIGPGHKRIEVQIRTHEMHHTAENGIAAHWSYKEGGGLHVRDAEKFTWLRQLVEFQQDVSDPAEFLEGVKVDLFGDEVFVFTPKGDVKAFARGATPIDFAYSIHSQIGEHCTGARVNGVIVPLRYKLRNGDVVEILTHKEQRPSKDWLEFVVSGRARSRIRTFLRSEGRKRAIKIGRELAEKECHRHGVSLSKWVKSGELDKALPAFAVTTQDELFAALGYGKISAKEVAEHLQPDTAKPPAEVLQPAPKPSAKHATNADTEQRSAISIDDVDNIVVRYAKCCSPLPGDPVTGWITRGRGVTVHRRGCQKAMELDPERKINIRWSDNVKIPRTVMLRVIAADRPGILAAMSTVFTERGVNIDKAVCRSPSHGQAENTFEITVTDVGTLHAVMRMISKIDGVYEVERV